MQASISDQDNIGNGLMKIGQMLPLALIVARIVTALLFATHAVVRIANGTIPRFGAFMETLGFPNGTATVWVITITELVAATMILTGSAVRYAAGALFCIAVGGILLIHRNFGWFVGEHGTGGSEYSVALIALLAVIAASDFDKALANKNEDVREPES